MNLKKNYLRSRDNSFFQKITMILIFKIKSFRLAPICQRRIEYVVKKISNCNHEIFSLKIFFFFEFLFFRFIIKKSCLNMERMSD